MKSTESKLIDVALLLNRISLGMLFVFAGLRKIFPFEKVEHWDLFFTWSGFVEVLRTLFSFETIGDKLVGFAEFSAKNAPLPEFLGQTYGFALPWVEIISGLLLLIGLYTRIAAVLIGLLLLSFLIAMGIDWWPTSGPAYTKNIILLTLSILIVAVGSGKYAMKATGPIK